MGNDFANFSDKDKKAFIEATNGTLKADAKTKLVDKCKTVFKKNDPIKQDDYNEQYRLLVFTFSQAYK